MSEITAPRHQYTANVFNLLSTDEKYLFKTHSLSVPLTLHGNSNSNFLLSINKCDDVTQEGYHIKSFTLDDNDQTPAECEIYQGPTYTKAVSWDQTLVTPEILSGSLHVILAPHSTYIIITDPPIKTPGDYYLLKFNWSEDR